MNDIEIEDVFHIIDIDINIEHVFLHIIMAQNYQAPIAGWCYPTKHDHLFLWVIGTLSH